MGEPTCRIFCSDGRQRLGYRPAHRRRRSLTQRQLADLAGVSHTIVQQVESLKRGAYPQTIKRLALALRVEPKDLL